MSILEEIVARKRVEIADRKRALPVDSVEAEGRAAPRPPPFAAGLRAGAPGLIAEVKPRSPSAGVLRSPLDPSGIAGAYHRAGARAISVLIDEAYFGGGERLLRQVRDAVDLPLLYKEFVIDRWQIWHARREGASAVLLIAGVLPPPELADFVDRAAEAGLDALVEVHDEDQMRIAADAGAVCIGVNNRDLTTFTVSLSTSERLAGLAPPGCTLISESGIRSAADVRRVAAAGYHAVLVGEHLLRQADVEAAVRELMGG